MSVGEEAGLYAGPVFDAHHHLWDRTAVRLPWLEEPGSEGLAWRLDAEDYRSAAGGLDLVGSVFVEALPEDPLAEILWADAEAARHPPIGSMIVGHADLDASDLSGQLDRLAAGTVRLRGIRDIVASVPGKPSFARQRDLLTRPAFAAGLAVLSRRGLVFDLMIEPHQVADALPLIDRFPSLRVAVEHTGNPDLATGDGRRRWRAAMMALSERPQVSVKISALHCRLPDWTDAALAEPIGWLAERFGTHRLAFASDFPVHDRHCPFERAFLTFRRAVRNFSPDEQRALFHETARRIYG